jgi:hypothetical protein
VCLTALVKLFDARHFRIEVGRECTVKKKPASIKFFVQIRRTTEFAFPIDGESPQQVGSGFQRWRYAQRVGGGRHSTVSAPGALGPSVSGGNTLTATALARKSTIGNGVHRWRYVQRVGRGSHSTISAPGAQARALATAIHSTQTR